MTDSSIDALQEQLEKKMLQKQKPINGKRTQATPERVALFEEMVPEADNKANNRTIEDEVVEELNEKHAVVHTDQFYILTEKPHSLFKGTDFTLESKQSFLNTYENRLVTCSDGGTTKSKARIWLAHSDRRQYNGITFNPNTTEHKNGLYNIWKGFFIKPVQGNCGLFKAHIKNVICNGNASHFKYVWSWCCRLIQKPEEIGETGLVLMSKQGTGKGVFVQALGKLLGQHFLQLDNLDRLLGNFNFHMKHAVLVYADEAIWGGNRKDIGKLKAMVTEKYAMIEPKGKDSFPVRNFRHFILSSNENWPLHLDPDDRRFFVLKVSNEHKEDIFYFHALLAELENGGYEALLYDLLYEDISTFDPRILPINVEAFEVKMKSTSSCEKYLYEALQAGNFDIGNSSTVVAIWRESECVESVFNDYLCWCEKQRLRNEQKDALGKVLHELIPSIQKKRPRRDGGGREHMYSMPSLAEARKEFETAFKTDSSIWE